MDPEGLFKVQDVNSIIKIFAFSIQDRFDELDSSNKTCIDSSNKYMPSQSIQDSEHLIRKYRNYKTSQQKQTKYLQKLVIRIMQILQFFKQRSKNQQLLVLILKKIEQKLNKIVKMLPIDVQMLYAYIIDIAKNGFYFKKFGFMQYSRSKKSSLRKIEVHQQHRNAQSKIQAQHQDTQKQKRAISTANSRPKRYVSLSAKKSKKNDKHDQVMQKQTLQASISRLYSVIDVDTNYIQRIAQSKDNTKYQKQSNKQNILILAAIQNYERNYGNILKKKQKNGSVDLTLKQVNNRACVRPVVNNWISRKRKINQAMRKKPIDNQNISFI